MMSPARADASLPYTGMMVGFGLGGIVMGRLADCFGVTAVVLLGAAEMLSLMLACGIVSRLVSGLVCDRIGGLRTLLLGSVLMATLFGMALGGWMSRRVSDLTGSYNAAFVNGIAWNLLNLSIAPVLLARLRGLPRRGPDPRPDRLLESRFATVRAISGFVG